LTHHRVRRRIKRLYPPPVVEIDDEDDELIAMRMHGLQ
jgi:hypothetical protein